MFCVDFQFFIQNIIIHDKIILFDVALLVQKTRCGRVTLNEALNNYGLSAIENTSSKQQIRSKIPTISAVQAFRTELHP